MRVLLLCFVGLSFATGVLGQSVAGNGMDAKPAASLANGDKASYGDEPYVVERLEHVVKMAADGTGTKRILVVARIQSEATVRQLGVIDIPFAGASEHVEIAYVRVRRPDGTVTETPVEEAIDMPSPVTTAAPFYSDLKQKQVPVRNRLPLQSFSQHLARLRGPSLKWFSRAIDVSFLMRRGAPFDMWITSRDDQIARGDRLQNEISGQEKLLVSFEFIGHAPSLA